MTQLFFFRFEFVPDDLNAIERLKELGWVQLIAWPNKGFTDQPPFCWLHARIELGDSFHKAMGSNQLSNSFMSNDAYLDAVFMYVRGSIFTAHIKALTRSVWAFLFSCARQGAWGASPIKSAVVADL